MNTRDWDRQKLLEWQKGTPDVRSALTGQTALEMQKSVTQPSSSERL